MRQKLREIVLSIIVILALVALMASPIACQERDLGAALKSIDIMCSEATNQLLQESLGQFEYTADQNLSVPEQYTYPMYGFINDCYLERLNSYYFTPSFTTPGYRNVPGAYSRSEMWISFSGKGPGYGVNIRSGYYVW